MKTYAQLKRNVSEESIGWKKVLRPDLVIQNRVYGSADDDFLDEAAASLVEKATGLHTSATGHPDDQRNHARSRSVRRAV